ncbi:MAG TPA: hypothetical protein HPP87_06180 [Planctomycetes bacterium]|nr:hypothetical protein [Planctomycetota bacterium]HIJ70935.1 hypothetical protein [Planctomycetota bacterium]
MSAVVILTPVVISSWPAITAAVAGAAAGLGMVVKETVKEAVEAAEVNVEQSVEVELADSEVLAESLATGKEIVVTKADMEIRVGRDERGRCTVCASGKGKSKVELKQIAEDFAQKMTQCFVYNRVMSEVKSRNFQVVNEEVMDDESVRIHVRRWVD